MIETVRIIGIDPGLRHSGWGIIDCVGNRLSFVATGVVASSAKAELAARLVELHRGLSEVIAKHTPHEAAVEQTFVSKDAVATLKLGQARGIALLVPAQAGLNVAEYAPNVIKKTVVGAGHADKVQIRAMVKMLLPKADVSNEHAADALAIAITHAHHRGARMLEARAG